MMRKEYVVTVMHDTECNKFIGWCDALPGLNACCDTVEELMETMEYSLPFVAKALAESHTAPDVPLIYQLAKFSEMRPE